MMQAWDVTVLTPVSYNPAWIEADLQKEYPLAHLTEGGAQKYNPTDGGWDSEFDRYYIDTVFFDESCDRDYVTSALINHDGYPSNIQIFKGRKY